MKKYHSYADLWDDLENQESFQVEKSILEFTLQLHQLMEKRKTTKTELANIIGTSQAYITKVFRGNANFTIASMVKLANALDGKLTIHITGKEEASQVWYRTVKGNKGAIPRWPLKAGEVRYIQNKDAIKESGSTYKKWARANLLEISA